jgi:hypothetical protein
VIAELSFGFWRQLLESRYFTAMWVPVTNKAFSDGAADLRARQREVAIRMRRLNLVRNRAAHHEPIHRRDLMADLDAASVLATWVSRDVSNWIRAKTRLRAVAEARP